MNAADQSRRLVLNPAFVSRRLKDVITHLGWPFLHSIPAGTVAANEYVWKMDEEHSFHYFECANYPVQYCIVVGTHPNDTLMHISVHLDFLDVDDLIGSFERATTVEEKELTTFALGLAAGENAEVDIYEHLRSSLNDPEPRVRLAGIDAAFIAGWEIFRQDFERLARTDPDPIVNKTAANALLESGFSGTAPARPV